MSRAAQILEKFEELNNFPKDLDFCEDDFDSEEEFLDYQDNIEEARNALRRIRRTVGRSKKLGSRIRQKVSSKSKSSSSSVRMRTPNKSKDRISGRKYMAGAAVAGAGVAARKRYNKNKKRDSDY